MSMSSKKASSPHPPLSGISPSALRSLPLQGVLSAERIKTVTEELKKCLDALYQREDINYRWTPDDQKGPEVVNALKVTSCRWAADATETLVGSSDK